MNFSYYCEIVGIKRELTAPYTPKLNKAIERKNRNIVEKAWRMQKSNNLPTDFLAEAMVTAVYLINIDLQHLSYKEPLRMKHGEVRNLLQPILKYLVV